MAVLGNLKGLISSESPTGLVLIGALIILTVINPISGVIAFLLTALLSQARENYGILEAGNIPVVKPTLFRGSEPNLHKTVLQLEDIKRFKKYGGIWGSYIGRTPYIYIADPELIRLVFVKDFVYFGDRQHVELGSEVLNEILDFLPGEKWRTLRNFLSPLFTTAKLKQMSDVIAGSAAEFMDDLKTECGTKKGRIKFDCRQRLSAFLIDMFAQTTLGVQLEDRKNPENKFAHAFRDMMGENTEYGLLYSLSQSFPILSKLTTTFNDGPTKLIESTFRQIIEARKKSGKKSSKDFCDSLCELWDRVPTKEFQDLGITETTVIAQAINFFLGGYETSTTVLSHMLLYLAEKPEIQEKMYAEVMEALARRKESESDDVKMEEDANGKMEIDHELIKDSEIPYIAACINEALRLAPPVIRPERICTKDWSHNGYSIKKGTITMAASWAANRNPKLYPDPDEFIPDRFLPENKSKLDPYAFTAFGFGPRNCVGMRFAYEDMKLFTCNLVKNFQLEMRADTVLEYKPGTLFMVGFSPLYLDLVERK